jgi:HPt (histidine-containing phosphotransfer) domain-containing protein
MRTTEDELGALPCFNPARMNEIAEQAGSNAIVYELLGLFSSDVEQRMSDLRNAVAKSDIVQCERIAHSIKGSCANLGAEQMASIARSMERCRPEAAPALLESLEREFVALKALLKQNYP